MCLVALAIGRRARFPFVVAANRDEFYARPTEPLQWWNPGTNAPEILSGRDARAGGTWLGLTRAGRFALLTNVRDPARHDADAPSRGAIVPLWLDGRLRPDVFWSRVALSGYNGFNLIAGDAAAGECFWASNTRALPQRLERGVWGLSNAALDTPWPKVQTLKRRVAEAVDTAPGADPLADALFAALADRTFADDAALPATGVPADWERALSAAFIAAPDKGYGTRCSTLVITERSAGGGIVTHVLERTFDAAGATLRRVELTDWPPDQGRSVAQSARTISTCGMPASSNIGPRGAKPARE